MQFFFPTIIAFLSAKSSCALGFSATATATVHVRAASRNGWTYCRAKEVDDEETRCGDGDSRNESDRPITETSTVRIGDGPSENMTNRFKYKVNALMGSFDPADAEKDNENQNGNIFNAMLRFPVKYSFNAVGKTEGVDEKKEIFIAQVRSVVLQETGELEDQVSTKITPRGSKFTKVTVSVEVQSADMINTIYGALEKIEMSIMQF